MSDFFKGMQQLVELINSNPGVKLVSMQYFYYPNGDIQMDIWWDSIHGRASRVTTVKLACEPVDVALEHLSEAVNYGLQEMRFGR